MSIWDGMTPESHANIVKNRNSDRPNKYLVRRAYRYAPGEKAPTYGLHDTAKDLVASIEDKRAAMSKFDWHPGVMKIRVFRSIYRWWVQYPIGTYGVGLQHFTTWDIAMRFADIRAGIRAEYRA